MGLRIAFFVGLLVVMATIAGLPGEGRGKPGRKLGISKASNPIAENKAARKAARAEMKALREEMRNLRLAYARTKEPAARGKLVIRMRRLYVEWALLRTQQKRLRKNPFFVP